MFGLGIFHFVALVLLISDFTDASTDTFQCRKLLEYDASNAGFVSSPFYGARNYHNGIWCEYKISAPEGYRLKLTFKDFDISPSNGCRQDQLTVYSKNKAEVLGIFCGTQLPNPILSTDNELNLLLISDYMVSGRGFLIQYESSPYLTSLCDERYTECKNRNCYKNDKKCNGFDDCGDGTDEENCGRPIENFPEKCGTQAILPNVNLSPDRMVGGDEAVANSWPWQASLQSSNSEPNGHFCGGTLINAQWVLTATHCVAGRRDPSKTKVHLGAHGSNQKTEYEQVRRAIRFISYPDLEGNNILNYKIAHDVTLVKLNAPVTFNKGVQPACLPQSDWKVKPGDTCVAAGWGETRGSGFSDWLKQVVLTAVSRDVCAFSEETQICVKNRWQSPCHGDSGGPLNCKRDGKWYVFGAASTSTTDNLQGKGICAGPEQMTVYADVSSKVEWIKNTINKHS